MTLDESTSSRTGGMVLNKAIADSPAADQRLDRHAAASARPKIYRATHDAPETSRFAISSIATCLQVNSEGSILLFDGIASMINVHKAPAGFTNYRSDYIPLAH
jgi:hypothetical protein